ncbi:MAG: MFS transporter, partial [Gammaproteobacteria bacterium]
GAGLLALFFWLMVGDLGIAMRERAALPAGLEWLRRHGASDTTTALLLSTVPALLSVLLVPFVGYHSDRHRGRWGRRRPFIAAAALAGALAMATLAASPTLGAASDRLLGGLSPGAAACTLAWFCAGWTLFECASITAFALFTGLINDTVSPRLLGRFYAAIRVVGLSVGIAFNAWLFALTEQYLFEILTGVGVLFSVSLLLMCARLREPTAPAQPARARSVLVPRAHILDCFRDRSLWWVFAAFMCAAVTFSPFNTFCQYYAQALGMSKAELGALTARGYAVSIASAFAIGAAVDRYGALRVSTILMGLYCVAALAGCLWVQDAPSLRWFYTAHVVLSGAYFTAAASLPMALFDSARFVQFNSTKDLLAALAAMLVGSLQGMALDWSGHDYRLTLLSACVFSLLAAVCLLLINHKTK